MAPGPTATPLFRDGKGQHTIDRLAGLSPLERLGRPEDIAEVVTFLAGPAPWVNGQILYANGGVSSRAMPGNILIAARPAASAR